MLTGVHRDRAVAIDAIPAELRERPQWVVWRREPRDGKPTKVPYSAQTLRRASVDDPGSWSPFEIALRRYRGGGFDGVGFVLCADDPYVGIDLDHAIDDEGVPAPWASEIIAALDSYTELSPSVRGFRIFVRARLPAVGNRRGPVEMYDRRRYMTVTGWHVPGTPTTIERREDELRTVHERFVGVPRRPEPAPTGPKVELDDRELLMRALRAANGAKFALLWGGDTSAYGGDDSRADMAMASMLAFWTRRDPGRIDRLFRASALMREKWDRPYADGTTYGHRTIARALGCQQRPA